MTRAFNALKGLAIYNSQFHADMSEGLIYYNLYNVGTILSASTKLNDSDFFLQQRNEPYRSAQAHPSLTDAGIKESLLSGLREHYTELRAKQSNRFEAFIKEVETSFESSSWQPD
jgi:hypothetical protein